METTALFITTILAAYQEKRDARMPPVSSAAASSLELYVRRPPRFDDAALSAHSSAGH